MFGYVTANELELKVKEFQKYKAYYCGLCQCLKNKYGFVGQMTLTYDMTFAILLLTSLYESETKSNELRCMVHPVKKVGILQNEITEYAADMNLILAYYHLKDDWEDEKKITALTGTAFLKKKVQKAIEQYPRQAAVIADYIRYLTDFVTELNVPTLQLEKLSGIFESMKKEPLPESREEFENRAMLYHILMDLEEFLITKRRFVNREAKKGS